MRFEGTKAYVATDDLKIAVNAAINPADVELPAGKVKLTSAGSMAFGPPGRYSGLGENRRVHGVLAVPVTEWE